MSDTLTQIAAVVAALRNGQIASYEAVAQVLEFMQRHCEITDPTPQFSAEEREEIISSPASRKYFPTTCRRPRSS